MQTKRKCNAVGARVLDTSPRLASLGWWEKMERRHLITKGNLLLPLIIVYTMICTVICTLLQLCVNMLISTYRKKPEDDAPGPSKVKTKKAANKKKKLLRRKKLPRKRKHPPRRSRRGMLLLLHQRL